MENKGQISNLYQLQSFIKKKVNLADFIERETNCKIIWYQEDVYAGTVCPMPNHPEAKPSFKIKRMEDDTWTFNCFGCGVGGTIINFCMDYFGIKTWEESVEFICKKMNIPVGSALDENEIKDSKKRVYLRKKVECAHIVTANQCRNLLKKDYDRYGKWVANSYKALNEALDKDDIDVIESIGYQATDKIQEK